MCYDIRALFMLMDCLEGNVGMDLGINIPSRYKQAFFADLTKIYVGKTCLMLCKLMMMNNKFRRSSYLRYSYLKSEPLSLLMKTVLHSKGQYQGLVILLTQPPSSSKHGLLRLNLACPTISCELHQAHTIEGVESKRSSICLPFARGVSSSYIYIVIVVIRHVETEKPTSCA